MSLPERIRAAIQDVPDFPKPGIIFKDITPMLSNGPLFQEFVNHLADRYRTENISQVVGIESRGFILGAPLAHELGVGFTLIRKPGKLPRATRSVTYALEYGTDTLTMHADALSKGEKVVLVDDVLATGGTAAAACELVESCGAILHEITFLMELGFLDGRSRLGNRNLHSVLTY